MKFKKGKENKIALDMTPMIDVVFQLLVFFLFTFKIVDVEGEIGINMPPLSAGSTVEQEPPDIQKIPIQLASGPGGTLANIRLGETDLGNDLKALTDMLKRDFGSLIGPGDNKVEVELDADRLMHYYWVIRATNAIMRSGIEQINFTDPKTKG